MGSLEERYLPSHSPNRLHKGRNHHQSDPDDVQLYIYLLHPQWRLNLVKYIILVETTLPNLITKMRDSTMSHSEALLAGDIGNAAHLIILLRQIDCVQSWLDAKESSIQFKHHSNVYHIFTKFYPFKAMTIDLSLPPVPSAEAPVGSSQSPNGDETPENSNLGGDGHESLTSSDAAQVPTPPPELLYTSRGCQVKSKPNEVDEICTQL